MFSVSCQFIFKHFIYKAINAANKYNYRIAVHGLLAYHPGKWGSNPRVRLTIFYYY